MPPQAQHADQQTGFRPARSPIALVTRGVTLLLLTALTAQLSAGDLATVSRSLARSAHADAAGIRDASFALVRAVRKLADEPTERPDVGEPGSEPARLALAAAHAQERPEGPQPPPPRRLKHADLSLPPPARA